MEQGLENMAWAFFASLSMYVFYNLAIRLPLLYREFWTTFIVIFLGTVWLMAGVSIIRHFFGC